MAKENRATLPAAGKERFVHPLGNEALAGKKVVVKSDSLGSQYTRGDVVSVDDLPEVHRLFRCDAVRLATDYEAAQRKVTLETPTRHVATSVEERLGQAQTEITYLKQVNADLQGELNVLRNGAALPAVSAQQAEQSQAMLTLIEAKDAELKELWADNVALQEKLQQLSAPPPARESTAAVG